MMDEEYLILPGKFSGSSEADRFLKKFSAIWVHNAEPTFNFQKVGNEISSDSFFGEVVEAVRSVIGQGYEWSYTTMERCTWQITGLPPHQDTGTDIFLINKERPYSYQSWVQLTDGSGMSLLLRKDNREFYEKVDALGYPVCLIFDRDRSFKIKRQHARIGDSPVAFSVPRSELKFTELKTSPGDLLIFRTNVIHASNVLHSFDQDRWAFAIRFFPPNFRISLRDAAMVHCRNEKLGLSESKSVLIQVIMYGLRNGLEYLDAECFRKAKSEGNKQDW